VSRNRPPDYHFWATTIAVVSAQRRPVSARQRLADVGRRTGVGVCALKKGRTDPMADHLTKNISTKVTAREYDRLVRLANGQTLSAWVRGVLFATTIPSPIDQVLLAEMLALRTILLNLHFAVASGEPPTLEAMKRLIERADDEKYRRAFEQLTAPAWRP
jgi:hypothetical protein